MRDEIAALVFGPGLPPGGATGLINVTPGGIEVSVEKLFPSARFNELSVREIGFEAPGVELAWCEGEDTWAVHVLDNAAAKKILALPALASAQVSALKKTQQRRRTGRAIGWSLIGFIVVLPGLLLALLVLNADALADWIAKKIPIEQEVSMGRQAFEGMRGNLKLVDEGPAYEAVKSIVGQLTQGSQYKYDVHVTKDDTLNAFAVPGGVIVVHTGLIAATKTPEELAGVLAHEVQHVEQRHSIKGMIKDMGLRGLWATLTGDIGGTLAGQAALELTSLRFSRDDETDADQKGFDALVSANIDPAGMATFFKTMGEQSADAPAAFISTHPLSVDRNRDLQQRVENLSRREFAALHFGAWPP